MTTAIIKRPAYALVSRSPSRPWFKGQLRMLAIGWFRWQALRDMCKRYGIADPGQFPGIRLEQGMITP